jgi:hypothetical protein
MSVIAVSSLWHFAHCERRRVIDEGACHGGGANQPGPQRGDAAGRPR